MKKITSVLLMLSLILCVICASTVNVGAVSSRIQDGIEVMITTDKEEYSKNEDIQATVTIINNNSYRLTDVSIETLLPEGLELKTGSLYSKNIVVESGLNKVKALISVRLVFKRFAHVLTEFVISGGDKQIVFGSKLLCLF